MITAEIARSITNSNSVDTFLNEFMKSVDYLAYHLANPAESVDYNIREERIKNALKDAYLAGYAQCEKADKVRG